MVGEATASGPLSAVIDLYEAYLCKMRSSSLRAWLGLHLTVPQLKVLQLLVTGGPQGPGVLARTLCISPSTVTGLCDRLVERSLAAREDDPRDRRASRVVATEEGQRLIADLTATRREHLARLVGTLSDGERKLVAEALGVLLRAAEVLHEDDERTALP